MEFKGRKILVTGASSGIGRCVAIKLAQEHCRVVLCGRDKTRLEETKNMMLNAETHQCLNFDLCQFENYSELFDAAVNDGEKLTGIVHCAGVATVTPVRMLNDSTIKKIIDTNYTSFMCLVGMYARKKYSDGGSIVAVSAINAHYAQKYMSVYAATKAALEASVRTLAIELAEKKIRINTVVPGAVSTPMIDALSQEDLNEIVSKQLLGIVPPEQIAEMIMFLLSEDASYITGRDMYVDGGRLG